MDTFGRYQMKSDNDLVCTEDENDCGLCNFIRQIFEDFPKEEDPGCETAQRTKSKNASTGSST